MNLTYDKAREYIKEGDILLFRAGKFPSFGWWITSYTRGLHSHAAIAHWDGDRLYCVEMREFKGGRSVTLRSQVVESPGVIDVYRVMPNITVPEVNDDGSVNWTEKSFSDDVANNVTATALEWAGKPYRWLNIWNLFKGYAPFFRFLNRSKPDNNIPADGHVCSTLVASAYRKHYIDLCPNLSDVRTTPADLAQSSMINYIFTIN